MKNTNENTNVKKPFYKKWWFITIVGIVLLSAIFGSNEEENKPTTETPSVVETTENEVAEETKQEEKLVIELVAGEQGEYGTPITFNKGTEFEETVIGYHIPAGEYTATNIGEYMDQFNIYSDEIHKTEEGWEEPAEGVFVKLIDVGASEDFTIEDGQYIKIVEPAKFKIEQK